MKKLLLFGLLSAFAVSGCDCEYVQPGYVGVLVETMGGSKGSVTSVGVGRQWLGPGEYLYLFPTFKKTYVWAKSTNEGKPLDESISFQTKQGLSVNADVGITFHVEEAKVVKLFETYREGIDEITHSYLHNQVRQAFTDIAASMDVESVYGEGKTKLLHDVEQIVKDHVAGDGIVIEQVFLVNDLRLPQTVIDALNSKIAATQQAQKVENELRMTEAEAKKNVAQARGKAEAILAEAEAQAKANELLSKSINANLVEIKRIEKWDGHLPEVTGGAMPMMDMRGRTKEEDDGKKK